ncbi:hypothetical protein Hamer_G019481 [Homarus americanus]|uniref:Uncharacterized protein n=1 Tax=Homarus americanus TaxID=6706 RepID=A0A8J5MP49_HOMAM|nr:hypothetical protein Hamer_G019481 [Homarus americanus]
MDKFVIKNKYCATENKESEGPPAKKSKGDSDATTTASVHSSQKQKNKEEGTAPTDISESAASNHVQPHLKEYPKHCEGKSHARSFVGAWFDQYEWAEYSQERDLPLGIM